MKIQCQDCKKEFTIYGKKKKLKAGKTFQLNDIGIKKVPSSHIDHNCNPQESKYYEILISSYLLL